MNLESFIDDKGRDWPAEIYFPTEGCFLTRRYGDSDGCRRCLLGWISDSFGGHPDPALLGATARRDRASMQFARTMGEVINELYGDGYGKLYAVERFNDHPDTTDAMRVRVWNETARRHDYVRPRVRRVA